MKHKHHGFTVVEIAIVIAIIAILATIGAVSYSGIRDRARNTALTAELIDVSQKLTTYNLANNNNYPETLSEIDVIAPDDMTLYYTRSADKKSYQVTATSGATTYSLSHGDNAPKKIN